MTDSFVKRVLTLTFTLEHGTFGTSNANTLTVEGLRASAEIQMSGGPSFAKAVLRVFGMTQADMNALTVLSFNINAIANNTVKIAADGATVFEGNIINAWADYQSAPDVCLYVDAQSMYHAQVSAAQPISIKGSASVANMMQTLAGSLGLAFQNNGVTATLADPYFAGTAVDQIRAIAKAAAIDYYADRGTLAICSRGTPRAGDVPLIGADTGLIGYPTFDRLGVSFGCIFNPAIIWGGSVSLDTDVQQARGTWSVTGLAHHLESEKPGGAWMSQVKCTNTGYVALTR